MAQSFLHRSFAPIRKLLPAWLANPIRNAVTAVLTPAIYSYRTGHFRSSLKMAAVSRHGDPLPWYTYPAIDFLTSRSYAGKTVLEFGGGQSTLWWASHASSVVTFEANREWHDKIKTGMPSNVDLHHINRDLGITDADQINAILSTKTLNQYDIIIIDGLTRAQLFNIAIQRVSPNGIIICDNAEGYGFFEGFQDSGLHRVDFYGNAPGILLPHCTSIYFSPTSFPFDPPHPHPQHRQGTVAPSPIPCSPPPRLFLNLPRFLVVILSAANEPAVSRSSLQRASRANGPTPSQPRPKAWETKPAPQASALPKAGVKPQAQS